MRIRSGKGFLKILILLTCMMHAGTGRTQSVRLSGRVTDTLQQQIAFANVLAVNQQTESVAGFTVTDEGGRFSLLLPAHTVYELRVSFVGFVPFIRQLTLEDADLTNVHVELHTATNYLEAVQVIDQLPISVSGDTLIYDTDAFTNGRERKLGDVLKKLPGVEVDENGEVTVQGKKVNQLLVDGKPFFDGDSKLATKNLPAKAVDKVQVLNDYNEVRPMNGLDNEETLALNVELKEGMKHLVFGDVRAGVGPRERYLGHSNLFYYAPKLSINAILDANNIGEQGFTIQDYFRFTNGLNAAGDLSGTDLNVASEDLGFPATNRKNAQKIRTQLAAVNFHFQPDRRWSQSGYVIASRSRNELGSRSQRTYLNDTLQTTEMLASQVKAASQAALMKYQLVFTPHDRTYCQYSLLGQFSALDMRNSLHSVYQEVNRYTDMRNQQHPGSLLQQLNLYHTLNERNVLSWENRLHTQNQDPTLRLAASENPFPLLAALSDSTSWSQQRQWASLEAQSDGSYYHILGPRHHVRLGVGVHYLMQHYRSFLQYQQGNALYQEPDTTYVRNHNRSVIKDIYAAIAPKSKLGSFTISPALYLHQYEVAAMDQKKSAPFFRLSPSVSVKWRIRSTETLQLHYGLNTRFQDVKNLSAGLIITDYNALFQGNQTLHYTPYHSLNVSYSLFNAFDGLTIFANASFEEMQQNMISSVHFTGYERIQTMVNSTVPGKLLTGSLLVDKRFLTFRMLLSGDFSANWYQNYVDEVPSLNRSLAQTTKAMLQSTLYKIMEVKAGCEQQVNWYEGAQTGNTFVNYKPYMELDLKLWKGFQLESGYRYNHYRNQESKATSRYSFWDASLSYRPQSQAWEFLFSAYNLLNTHGIRQNSFTESLISTYAYFVQQRSFLLSVTYTL